jgi:hypothetical protein
VPAEQLSFDLETDWNDFSLVEILTGPGEERFPNECPASVFRLYPILDRKYSRGGLWFPSPSTFS